MAFRIEKHGLDEVFVKWSDEDPSERYMVHGKEYPSMAEAKAAVDALYGPDVVAEAMDSIKVLEWSKRGVVTKAQRRVLYKLANAILEHDGLGERFMAEYEFKEFELTWSVNGGLFLVTEVGRKGDEGTLGCMLCRSRRHIAVGVRGGLTNLNAPKYGKRRKGFFNCVTWGASDR